MNEKDKDNKELSEILMSYLNNDTEKEELYFWLGQFPFGFDFWDF